MLTSTSNEEITRCDCQALDFVFFFTPSLLLLSQGFVFQLALQLKLIYHSFIGLQVLQLFVETRVASNLPGLGLLLARSPPLFLLCLLRFCSGSKTIICCAVFGHLP